MSRILFVDDEPLVLEGLANLLRKQRRRWDMVFAPGGNEALAELAKGPFDVVVSDLRMPGMGGATLLRQVKDLYPGVARIVLSGHAERDVVVHALPVSHQYLNKPCDGETLQRVIERACELRGLLANPAMQSLVGQLERLPSVPETYWELSRAFSDPDVTMSTIAGIVEKDLAMSVKILQIVNSAYFGLAQRITSITHAVSYLGVELLRGLVLTAQIFSALEAEPPVPGFSIEALQASSMIVARLAKQIVGDSALREEAFTAGLVHDVGKIVLALRMPDELAETIEVAARTNRPFHVVEKELLGVTHADVGAFLLGSWGLPFSIVDAVAHHHSPGVAASSSSPVLTALQVADALTDEVLNERVGAVDDRLDHALLQQRGIAGQLRSWRSMAVEVARGRSQSKLADRTCP